MFAEEYYRYCLLFEREFQTFLNMTFSLELVQYTESMLFSVFFILLICCVTAVIASSCSEYLQRRKGNRDTELREKSKGIRFKSFKTFLFIEKYFEYLQMFYNKNPFLLKYTLTNKCKRGVENLILC